MSPAALQPHFGREPARPPVLRPATPPFAAPPLPPLGGPTPLPLRPEPHIPLNPETGMTRAEIERKLTAATEEVSAIKTKIATALALIGTPGKSESLGRTRERQGQIITLLAQIAG